MRNKPNYKIYLNTMREIISKKKRRKILKWILGIVRNSKFYIKNASRIKNKLKKINLSKKIKNRIRNILF